MPPEPSKEERAYYAVATLGAVVTLGLTLWLAWKHYMSEEDRARMKATIRRTCAPFWMARARAKAQTDLTWETFLVLEELENYDDDRGLAARLEVA